MKKRSLKALLLAGALTVSMLLTGSMAVGVLADAAYGWNVTFTSDGKMADTFNKETASETVSQMQPGDSAVFTVSVKNEHAQTTKWYMKNEVISSLEESAKAAEKAGGAYGYKLTYTTPAGAVETIFSSNTVGGEVYVNENLIGLLEVGNTINKDEWFYLMDMKTNDTGSVQLQVTLDGVSQGNAYQGTLADLGIQFAVELPESGSVATGTTGLAPVKTGDTSRALLYIILAAVAGVILLVLALVSMKKRKNEAEETDETDDLQDPEEKGGLK